MFEKARNIDSAFRYVRSFTALVVTGCLILSGYVFAKSYALSAALQNKIYVLAGDKVLDAYASTRKDNIGVEARDHVRTFHGYFFSLDPDEKSIELNIARALYLADGSAKKQYDALKETGYYAGVISGNIRQEISIDSVVVDTRMEPYAFRCYAVLKITRPTSVVRRSLVTQGNLRNVSRSDHNSHGFLVEKWETVENKDLSSEAR
ncbi:MAG: conjugative transposon protein TraK [Bacteroidota bacterium]